MANESKKVVFVVTKNGNFVSLAGSKDTALKQLQQASGVKAQPVVKEQKDKTMLFPNIPHYRISPTDVIA